MLHLLAPALHFGCRRCCLCYWVVTQHHCCCLLSAVYAAEVTGLTVLEDEKRPRPCLLHLRCKICTKGDGAVTTSTQWCVQQQPVPVTRPTSAGVATHTVLWCDEVRRCYSAPTHHDEEPTKSFLTQRSSQWQFYAPYANCSRATSGQLLSAASCERATTQTTIAVMCSNNMLTSRPCCIEAASSAHSTHCILPNNHAELGCRC